MRGFQFIAALAIACLPVSYAWSAEPLTTSSLVTQPSFRAGYRAMTRLPSWVETARATSTPVTTISIDGKSYYLGHMCKPHDCSDEQLEVILEKNGSKAWGLLSVQSGTKLRQLMLGEPPASIARKLDKAYDDNNPDDTPSSSSENHAR
ncbi:Ivy family c-type lysozyme inhibitor [Kozakia baliensis]|uniref:Uncharacterized protein n=1 Tax=Kozakia baliensis TaxID=153496 RepID=A0A1D8UU31_9PROT|nr:Ivy family c-type lysozyme inhibitor [Kozakia baliensis]AOX17154.1 hypothetical protein A0U89_08350 [Kozakia baliensis]GEL64467.1 inhibitor of vertebrate lysozyme [Kozakia baliensis]